MKKEACRQQHDRGRYSSASEGPLWAVLSLIVGKKRDRRGKAGQYSRSRPRFLDISLVRSLNSCVFSDRSLECHLIHWALILAGSDLECGCHECKKNTIQMSRSKRLLTNSRDLPFDGRLSTGPLTAVSQLAY